VAQRLCAWHGGIVGPCVEKRVSDEISLVPARAAYAGVPSVQEVWLDQRKRCLTKRRLCRCWWGSRWTRKLGAVRFSVSWMNDPVVQRLTFCGWGSRGRRFKSCQPDGGVVRAGQTLCGPVICDTAWSDLVKHAAHRALDCPGALNWSE
jgi:hypothetical protein